MIRQYQCNYAFISFQIIFLSLIYEEDKLGGVLVKTDTSTVDQFSSSWKTASAIFVYSQTTGCLSLVLFFFFFWRVSSKFDRAPRNLHRNTSKSIPRKVLSTALLQAFQWLCVSPPSRLSLVGYIQNEGCPKMSRTFM